MPTISTKDYLLDQAKRRFTPSITNFPGMSLVEKRLVAHEWPQHPMAEPPAGSDLKPVMGDAGLPIVGHMIEMFRGGPDYIHHIYKTFGPVVLADSPILPSIVALGPDATQTIFSNKNKDYSQKGWHPVIGPFFNDEFGDTFGNIYAVTGDGYSYAQLKETADRIRNELLRVKDVGKVDLVGEQDEPFLKGSHYMAEKIPNATIAVIQGAGHAPPVSHSDEFNTVLRTYPERLDP